MILTWLSYLTEQNSERKLQNYLESWQSLLGFKGSPAEVIIVDNAPVDDVSCARRRDEAGASFRVFKAANVCYDIAAHYVGLMAAQQVGDPYFAYAYDDFVFYRHDFVEPAIAFMDANPHVQCIRLPIYSISNSKHYNTMHTTKAENPDAVSHENSYRGSRVYHQGPHHFGGFDFYTSNWRPISRPTLWRTSAFESLIGHPNPCPIMQPFEALMYRAADAAAERDDWTSGFIDGGVCKTFSQASSERLHMGIDKDNMSPDVNLGELTEAFECPERWS